MLELGAVHSGVFPEVGSGDERASGRGHAALDSSTATVSLSMIEACRPGRLGSALAGRSSSLLFGSWPGTTSMSALFATTAG